MSSRRRKKQRAEVEGSKRRKRKAKRKEAQKEASSSSSSSSSSPPSSSKQKIDVERGSRTKLAKNAFENKDAQASKLLHEARSVLGDESGHQKGGDYLKSSVYGAMDGLITTFSVVTAVVGGGTFVVSDVIILGFANMLGDGISMGVGDYLSSTAEQKFIQREYEREMWECDNDIDAERAEMVELYAAKDGITEAQAKQIVDIISQDYATFVDIMMVEELGLMPPDEDDEPWKHGFVTFLAFVLFGTIPLIPYVFDTALNTFPGGNLKKPAGADAAFWSSIVLTLLMMFILGVATSRFTPDHWVKSGLLTMGNGCLAAGASFLIAFIVRESFGLA